MNVDAALEQLGARNKFVWFWYSLINFIKSSLSAFSILAFMWANAKPQSFHCKIPQHLTLNDSVPFDVKGGRLVPSQCFQYVNFSKNSNLTVPCQLGYEYTTYTTSSITTYWDLVCDRAYLSAMVDSCFFVLSIFASAIFTALSDNFGRRPVFIGCVLLFCVIRTLSTFAPNVYVYIAIRTLLGPIQHGVYTTGFCFSLELFPKERRGKPGFLSDLFWIISCVLLCGIAYFARDWKIYTYVTTLPFLLVVILIWVMPESVPWLVANGRFEEAEATLKRAQRYRGAPVLRDSFELRPSTLSSATSSQEAPTYPFYFVCTRGRLLRQSVLNFIIWVTVGCSYYGLQLQAIQIGNPYLTFLIINIVEVPSIVIIPILSRWFGRKALIVGGLIFTAGSLLSILYPKITESDNVALLVTLPVIGRFFVGFVWTVLFVHITEMYPTNLRTMGIAVGSMSSRLGTAIAPFLSMMEAQILWLPNVCIVVMNFVSCFAATVLPETKNWELPQTIEQVEEWSEQQEWPLCRRRQCDSE